MWGKDTGPNAGKGRKVGPATPLVASHLSQVSLALGSDCPVAMCLQASPGGTSLAAGLMPRSEAQAVPFQRPASCISQKAVHMGMHRGGREWRGWRGSTTHGLVCKMPGWALGLPGSQ